MGKGRQDRTPRQNTVQLAAAYLEPRNHFGVCVLHGRRVPMHALEFRNGVHVCIAGTAECGDGAPSSVTAPGDMVLCALHGALAPRSALTFRGGVYVCKAQRSCHARAIGVAANEATLEGSPASATSRHSAPVGGCAGNAPPPPAEGGVAAVAVDSVDNVEGFPLVLRRPSPGMGWGFSLRGLHIESVRPDSPAALCGLQTGLLLVAVDGTAAVGAAEVVSMLRAKRTATLMVQRADSAPARAASVAPSALTMPPVPLPSTALAATEAARDTTRNGRVPDDASGPHEVVLRRDSPDTPWGLTVVGGVVTAVAPGSPASTPAASGTSPRRGAASALLAPGHRIVAVDGSAACFGRRADAAVAASAATSLTLTVAPLAAVATRDELLALRAISEGGRAAIHHELRRSIQESQRWSPSEERLSPAPRLVAARKETGSRAAAVPRSVDLVLGSGKAASGGGWGLRLRGAIVESVRADSPAAVAAAAAPGLVGSRIVAVDGTNVADTADIVAACADRVKVTLSFVTSSANTTPTAATPDRDVSRVPEAPAFRPSNSTRNASGTRNAVTSNALDRFQFDQAALRRPLTFGDLPFAFPVEAVSKPVVGVTWRAPAGAGLLCSAVLTSVAKRTLAVVLRV